MTTPLSVTAYPVTGCAWVKYSAATQTFTNIVTTNGVGNPFMLFVINDPGNADYVQLYNNNQVANSAVDAIRAGEWFHTCASISGSNFATVYVNGAISGTPGDLGAPSFPGEFSIGATNVGASKLIGLLDDVRFYNRALTPAEVKQLYQLGTVRITQ